MTLACLLCADKHGWDTAICPTCTRALQRYTFLGCPRCGRDSCSGCAKLHDFRKVESLFQLHKANANLLVDAKDRQADTAIQILKAVFLPPFVKRCEQIIASYDIKIVIFSPLRVTRFFTGGWHLMLELYAYLDERTEARCIFPLSLHQRQSLIARHARGRVQGNENYHLDTQIPEIMASQNVLVVDDVLTTGDTASKTRESFEQCFPDSSWIFLSAFRTQIANTQ